MRVLIVTLIAAVAWLSACNGGSEDSDSAPEPTEPASVATQPAAPTLEPPAATPDPRATPPADWTQFGVDEYSIWMPPRFAGGPLGSSQGATLQQIALLGGVCQQASQSFAGLGDAARLLVVDRERCVTGVLSNIIVLKQGSQGFDAAEFAEALAADLRETLVVSSVEPLRLGSHDAARILIDGRIDDPGVGRSMQMVIGSGETTWVLIFSSGPELASLLPEFEQIALTFEDSLSGD
jgi:hypothetical protein